MGYRLSKIYTRTGDNGDTGLADGRRVAKNHARIEAIGEVDTLNCHLGLLLAELSTTHSTHPALTGVSAEVYANIDYLISAANWPCLSIRR